MFAYLKGSLKKKNFKVGYIEQMRIQPPDGLVIHLNVVVIILSAWRCFGGNVAGSVAVKSSCNDLSILYVIILIIIWRYYY